LIVSLLVIAITAAIGCQRDAAPRHQTTADNKALTLAAEGQPAVELVVDYGDGVEKRFKRIPIHGGMTVLGALRFTADRPHGIKYEMRGEGDLAFLTKIDDLSNQGGGDGRNWLYRVNGKPATKSFDAYVVSPGDVILWKYEAGAGVED
jgi:uncharacterized protein DUF4430